MSKWCGSWPGVLVVALTVSRTCCPWEGVAKTVNGLVDGHVAFFKHGFDALEVRSAGKVTAVDDRTDVRPFGVHGTGGVNDKGQLNFSATGIVPSDLNVVVGVDNHIGVALVADDGRQQGVIKQGDNGA